MPDGSTKPVAMPVSLVGWRAMRKGALLGFASVRIGKALTINDVPVLSSSGRVWASLPGKPVLDAEGRQKRDDRGKPVYVPMAAWADRETANRFSDAVVGVLEREHPADLQPEQQP